MATFLALVASVLNLVGYVWYDRDLLRGAIKPNLSSWLIWVGITLLSVSSYTLATGDLVKSALSLSILLANVVTIFLILRRAHFSRLAGIDIAAIAIAAAAAAVWKFSDNALLGNAVIQAAIVVGGIPTIRSVWMNPQNEKPGPWLLWGLAFIAATVVVLLRWTGKPLELLYPVLGILLYGSVGVLAAIRRRAVPPQGSLQSQVQP